MDNIWYDILQFQRKVAIFLNNSRLVDMEHLLEMGQELLREDIGEEKVTLIPFFKPINR